MEGYTEVCAALLTMMLAVSTAIGFGLSRLALRPVRLIRKTANRIRSDNLSERIPVPDVKDEISDLARLLNQMFDRLEHSFEQIRRFTADASHELKTPLSLIRLHAEKLMVDGTLNPKQEEEILLLLEELTRLNKIIEELLFLSRVEARSITLELKPHNPISLLHNFMLDARALAEHNGLTVVYAHEGNGVAICEPRWLHRVQLNLVTNAINASPLNGRITIKSVLANQRWCVSIEDEGLGIPDHERERIFDRFVRLKSSAETEGSGLGLAICRSIIELHHGRIYAEAGTDGRGLRIVFEVPALAMQGELPKTLHTHQQLAGSRQ